MPPVNKHYDNEPLLTTYHVIHYPPYQPPREGDLLYLPVLPRPRRSRGGNTTWTVDAPPGRRLTKGTQVVLTAADAEVARGRLSIITDLRRHWVTFKISGGNGDGTYVRTPIVWAHLEGLERHTHANLYSELSPISEPHWSYRVIPEFRNSHENPYVPREDTRPDREMEKRLVEIRNQI